MSAAAGTSYGQPTLALAHGCQGRAEGPDLHPRTLSVHSFGCSFIRPSPAASSLCCRLLAGHRAWASGSEGARNRREAPLAHSSLVPWLKRWPPSETPYPPPPLDSLRHPVFSRAWVWSFYVLVGGVPRSLPPPAVADFPWHDGLQVHAPRCRRQDLLPFSRPSNTPWRARPASSSPRPPRAPGP